MELDGPYDQLIKSSPNYASIHLSLQIIASSRFEAVFAFSQTIGQAREPSRDLHVSPPVIST